MTLFGLKNNHFKNGIWWFTKIINAGIGEQRYDYLRMFRRIQLMRFYYMRQQLLYECFIDHPDLAQWLGVYPKQDSSHGFPFVSTYEMYRDFQENTVNSDGAFAQWITMLSFLYISWVYYSYMVPYYWIQHGIKNDENTRLRMKDALASCCYEEAGATDFVEWCWQPHDFAYNTQRAYSGYSYPDDTRLMHMASYNRANRYKDTFEHRIGDQHHMTYPK